MKLIKDIPTKDAFAIIGIVLIIGILIAFYIRRIIKERRSNF
jgi:hypothetical protein